MKYILVPTSTTTSGSTTSGSSTTTSTTTELTLDFCFDESRFFGDVYNHQPVDGGNAHEKDYFYISAPDFTNNLCIGFSNGYTDHNDKKWEIVAGGWSGREFIIRQGNAYTASVLAKYGKFADSSKWERLRSNLAVQVRDGNIALYSANSNGTKKDLLVEWNDDTIIKSDLNTLTITGGYGGTGNVQISGVCVSS